MDILTHSQGLTISDEAGDQPRWRAGPITSNHSRKGFTRDGSEMKVVNMTTYILEVFPPNELGVHMQLPAPDITRHLAVEGVDIGHLDRRHVSFLAYVSLPQAPDDFEDTAAEIVLISMQRQDGGVYKHDTKIPQHMLQVRKCPIETALDSLNHALHQHNWYPSY